MAQTGLAPYMLRQERHGDDRHKQRHGRALSSKHAAPDGSRVVFVGSSSINTALRTELPRSWIQPKTAKKPTGRPRRASLWGCGKDAGAGHLWDIGPAVDVLAGANPNGRAGFRHAIPGNVKLGDVAPAVGWGWQ